MPEEPDQPPKDRTLDYFSPPEPMPLSVVGLIVWFAFGTFIALASPCLIASILAVIDRSLGRSDVMIRTPWIVVPAMLLALAGVAHVGRKVYLRGSREVALGLWIGLMSGASILGACYFSSF